MTAHIYYDGTFSFCGSNPITDDNYFSLASNCGTATKSDIIEKYMTYGFECPRHIKGTFAFCIFDKEKQTLLAARDRLGEKSLYYSQLPSGFIFSTSLKEIIKEIKYPIIDVLQFSLPIRYNFPIDLEQTWISQIKRVKAGEYLIVDKDGIQKKQYWKRDHSPLFKGTKEEAIKESLHLMRQSVKRCIDTADGPVAVLLSGGIDSSSLAVFTQEFQNEVHVISAGYKGNAYTVCDERKVAKRFAQERGYIYHEAELDVNDFVSILDELIPFLDEPCFDVSCMAQFALYKKAAEMGFKVILSGLGGDEQFYSYSYHNKIIKALELRRQFLNFYPVKKHKIEYLRFLKKNWKYVLLPNHPVLMDESIPIQWTYQDYQLFAENAALCLNDSTIFFKDIDVHFSFPQSADTNFVYDFMMSTFASQLCVYLGNKLCEANGVQFRCPLLDSDLVEFLDSIPLEMKFDINKPKQFQKDILSGIVPDYILYAEKRGFEPPFEFIKAICSKYKYKHFNAEHCFFNSMVADRILDNLF